MNRRFLLQSAAALPWLSLLPGLARARAPGPQTHADAHCTQRRVRPSDPDWPDAAQWQALAAEVGGQLARAAPLLAACEAAAKGAACSEVLGNLRNPFYLQDQVSGTEVSGWLDAWTPAPSAYCVDVRTAADVAAAVKFSRKHALRLVVKGTGHSYLGTSNAPDSLLIRTHAMRELHLHEAFVPAGCDGHVTPTPAVSAQAGAVWFDLYSAVTTRGGRYVQGGGCTSVGVAGLVQSGGFGSFSKAHGTAASRLLEAEIVTADGRVRVVNACRNPDLFWALKGGGGGSWGVITRLTLRTSELQPFAGGAFGKVQAKSAQAFQRLLARFVSFYHEHLLNPHWGESVKVSPQNVLQLSLVSQGLDTPQSEQLWKPFFDWIAAAPQDFTVSERLRTGGYPARSWWDPDKNHSLLRDERPGVSEGHAWWDGDQGQVGAYLHGYDSLWLPVSLLEPQSQSRLVDALFAASRHKEVELHFNKGLAGASPQVIAATRDTATNPAVLEAFALAIIADGEGPAYPGFPRPALDLAAAHEDARAIDRATAELKRIVPDAGSYVSESNFFNERWQQAYWGPNYARLRAVKDKYDPDGLFFVHHGVGSEDWSADGFVRTRAC
jgi:FAD/FMN-containing dehydrogenase